jgi:hypothetical protein
MIEAGTVPELKGVFQRLYEDAIQRIQRYTLIREQVDAATRAYSDLVNSPKNIPMSDTANPMTPLDQLSVTASATLQGMWYPGERSWKKACEWAIAEAMEAHVSKQATGTVDDLMEHAAAGAAAEEPVANDGDQEEILPNQLAAGLPRRTAGRRGPRGYPGAWSPSQGEKGTADNGRSFWHPLPGGLGPETFSPRKLRKAAVTDPEPSAFTNYVAQLRAARGDLGSAEWPRLTTANGGRRGSGESDDSMLAASRSLPALPKGRGML